MKVSRRHNFRELAKRPPIGSLYRELARRPLIELVQRHCIEVFGILPRSPLQGPYIDLSKRSLVDSFYKEISQRNLLEKSCTRTPLIKILYRNITYRSVQGSCQEVSYRDFAKSYLIDILYRDLARRPLLEILYRDVAKRIQILLKDLSWRS